MAINFLNSIDLNKNQLINPRFENLSQDPAANTNPVEGQVYYNTTSDVLRVYVGDTGGGAAGWQNIGISSLTLTGDVTGSGTSSIATTISALAVETGMIAAGAVSTAKIADSAVSSAKLASSAVTTAKIGSGAVTTAKIDSGAVTFTKMAGNAIVTSTENFTSIASDSNIPTSKAIKEYVDLVSTGNLVFIGGINAANGTPVSGVESGNQFYNPSTTPVADRNYEFDVNKDEFFVITTEGNWLGISSLFVTVGDSVICSASNGVSTGSPVNSADWTIVQADRDLATLTTVGIGNVNKANDSMVVSYNNSGTAQIKVNSANFTVVGNGSATVFNFTNTLGSIDGIIASVTEVSTGEICFPSVKFHTVNSVATLTVTFAVAPVNSKRYQIACMRVA